MANFMARYRGGDGHYADVECAYAEPEQYVVLSSATGKKKATSLVALVIRAMRRTRLFANDAARNSIAGSHSCSLIQVRIHSPTSAHQNSKAVKSGDNSRLLAGCELDRYIVAHHQGGDHG
jgi:hypothetical protein